MYLTRERWGMSKHRASRGFDELTLDEDNRMPFVFDSTRGSSGEMEIYVSTVEHGDVALVLGEDAIETLKDEMELTFGE